MASLKQQWFGFVKALSGRAVSAKPARAGRDIKSGDETVTARDAALEKQSRPLLTSLGLDDGARKLSVVWNPRMRSTAGYARWPEWRVELNPRLREFDGQVERTLKHELAHLVAYERAGRRRIAPHGTQWRKACADLGIPDESTQHTLPLPRSKQARKYLYECPVCHFTVSRVRKFRRHTACLACCKKHNRGRYDARFQFVMKPVDSAQAATPSSRA